MSDSASRLPARPSLEQLHKQAKVLLRQYRAGESAALEALWCMYCRETGNAATEHIAGLSRLKTYYAGKTRITDRSLEILGKIGSLERLEFWQCAGITDTGVAHLAGLPRLREISLDDLPNVTRDAVTQFPTHVQVRYSG